MRPSLPLNRLSVRMSVYSSAGLSVGSSVKSCIHVPVFTMDSLSLDPDRKQHLICKEYIDSHIPSVCIIESIFCFIGYLIEIQVSGSANGRHN